MYLVNVHPTTFDPRDVYVWPLVEYAMLMFANIISNRE